MPDIELNFSRGEYAERLAKVQDAMAAAGVECLLVTAAPNMAWLTGHDGWSFYVHQCVVVPVDEQPLWYGRRQDAKGALRAVYMAETRILGYPDHDIQTRERHPMDHLSAVLRDRGLAKGTLGVEMDNYYLSATADAAADAALRHYLPDVRFADAAVVGPH